MPERLLTDEHLDARVVLNLRRRHGHDVVTVRQLCSDKYGDGFDDASVLKQAADERRIVITDNRRDFRDLLFKMPWHSGIVLCPVYVNAAKKADRITACLKQAAATRGFPHFTGLLLSIPPEAEEMPKADVT